MKIPEGQEQQYRAALEAKLHPDVLRSTLAFVGLFQLVHEMIKDEVLDKVRGFYWRGIENGKMLYAEDEYQERVLSKAPKNKFKASLLWLVEGEAITHGQADRLDAIYAHRHDLTHELMKYLVDPEFSPDVALFKDALAILRAIKRFWTEIEISIGSFEDVGDDITADDAVPADLMVLNLALDAFVDGLPEVEV